MRKANGNLSFTVNGRDLGLAATNVPDNVYGVLDLYGQASEASIVPPGGKLTLNVRLIFSWPCVEGIDSVKANPTPPQAGCFACRHELFRPQVPHQAWPQLRHTE